VDVVATLSEPYVQLVDVTTDAALIAWGGFRLAERDGVWLAERAGETLGARSAPVGRAAVEVVDQDGAVVARTVTDEANHAWVHGLRPATTYGYRVLVDGEPWTASQRYDWTPRGLAPAWRPLTPQLRTHAAADDPDPVTFLALGDFGVGIDSGVAGQRQLQVARTMQRLADANDIRFIVGLGDSIYHGPGGSRDHSGAHDDDWWLTFFQPYRYLIDHLPFYPTAGNHDGPDDEDSDDRAQLEDNLYLRVRFEPRQESGRAAIDPGLFYRLQVGSLVELVCVDTTWDAKQGMPWFNDPGQQRWLRQAFPNNDVRWQLPFCHHPSYCAGPHHESMTEQVRDLLPLYQAGGVQLMLHGHEHNFQHGEVDGLHYMISGAGGKLDERAPTRFAESGTVSWATVPHCLLVQVTADRLVIVPYGATPRGGQPSPIPRRLTDGTITDAPIVLTSQPG
jgi:tartrate-resistant acid phosphatase type 5